MQKEKEYLHLISHTHWDREWYKTFQQFRWRFVKMMDHLLGVFEKNEEFKSFTLDGQVLVLKDYFEIRPEKKGQVKELIRQGKLLIGPFYSQPNEFMVSGEALIRNLILGFKEAEELGGAMKVCYLPDAFGHISQLPQVAKGFGMEDIVVWRGLPRDSKTVFNWEGADGSSCLVFYMYDNYGIARALPFAEENFIETIDFTDIERKGLKERVKHIRELLEAKTTTPHLLAMNGIDHAFAQANLPEIIKKINDIFPEIEATQSKFPEYIKKVRQYHQEQEIPYQKASGELRDSSESLILPGSQSTRSSVKQFNEKIEGLFEKWMEPFATFAWLTGADYSKAFIWKAWEYLLQNQSHDSLACSSLDQTFHQVMTRFEWAQEVGEEVIKESLQILCNQINTNKDGITVGVFNPLNWIRDEIITTTLDVPKGEKIAHPALLDEENNIIPLIIMQRRDNEIIKYSPRGIPDVIPVDRYRVSFKLENIPANGYKALTLVDQEKTLYWQGSLIKGNGLIENEYLKVNVNSNGTLDVFDKRTSTEYKSLHFFEDSGEAGEGFSHVAPSNDSVFNSRGCSANISVVEDNLLKAVYKIDMIMDLPEAIRQDRQSRSEELVPCSISSLITIKAGTPRIDIETKIKNLAKDHRLRVVFPTNLNTNYSYAEQPFDVVQRQITLPDFNDYPGEKPSPTHPQLSFVDVNDNNKGLLIANHGLYSYEVKDNQSRSIALTLLRCTDKLHFGTLFKSEETQIPEAQCIGEYTFQYSIIPHQGSWKNAYKDTYNFKYPPRVVPERDLEEKALNDFNNDRFDNNLPSQKSFINIEPENLILTAVKKHEVRDSIIIRLFNPEDELLIGKIKLPGYKIKKAYQVNLNEDRETEIIIEADNVLKIRVEKKRLFTAELIIDNLH